MSVDRKEIDLIIKAALQGGKTLESVAKSISDIEKAIEAQTDAAKRGEGSIDELKASLASLKQVQDQLKGQADLIGQYERLGKQIEASGRKVEASAKAHSDYKEKLDKAGKSTDFQANKLIKLANAAERNQQTLSRQRADQEALAASLTEAGISIDQLALAETKARQSAAQLGVAINRVQNEISSYADTVRQARAEQAKMAENEAFQRKLDEAAKLNKAGEYVRFWQDALQRADQTEQQLKVSEALRKTADEAIAAARGYQTLGNAAKSISGTQNSLRDTVNAILDPSAKARETLEGVEAQIKVVAQAAKTASGPVEDYASKFRTLTQAADALTKQSNLVDQFSKQVSALRQARSEFVQARASVIQYAEAVRNSSGENLQLQNSLKQAQVTLAAAEKNLSAQLQTTRGLRDSMRQAGLATNDLSATQSRLVNAAQTTVGALKNLSEAKRKYGEATRDANNAEDMFTSNGRTTLSYIQRLRGEVLSLVAAYAGIYGAIDGARKALDAFSSKQGIINQLALSAGDDSSAIAAEYNYIREQADRIGIAFEQAAKGYAKFSASGKMAGKDQQTIRYIFETFSEVGKVAELSAENMDGIFKALEQVMSKGTIQAEELRGQLGDRLFGAFQVAAQALKDQFPELDKAMKNGLVTSDQLVKIAEKYKEVVANRLPAATESLTASQNRFNSAVFDFKVLVAESGFADEYAKLLESLTTFFKSTDGQQFAKDISDGLSAVVKGLRLIVEHSETVKTILITGVLLAGAKAIGAFAIALVGLPARIAAIATAAATASTYVAMLNKTFMALNAFGAGYMLGTLLNEFDIVKKWAVGLIYLFEVTWSTIKYGAKIIWAEIPAFFSDGLGLLGNIATSGVRGILGLFSSAAKALGKDDLGKSLDDAIASLRFRVDKLGDASAQIRRQFSADLAHIKKTSRELIREIENPTAAATGGTASPTAKPSTGTTGKPSKASEEEVKRRVKLKEDVEAALADVENRIVKNEKESLDQRLLAIYNSYEKLRNKIIELGGAEGRNALARLNQAVGDLQIQEIEKYNGEIEKSREASLTRLEQMEAAAGRKTKTDLQMRLDAIALQYADHYRELAKLRELYVLNGRDTSELDATKGRMDNAVEGLKALETQKFYEEAVNILLEERKAKLDAIVAQEKAGLLTSYDANIKATEVVDQLQPRLEAIVAEGLAYADAMIQAAEATGQNVTALEVMRAKLLEAKVSNQGLNKEAQVTRQLNQSMADGATSAFMKMAQSWTAFAMGQKTAKEATQETRDAFLGYAADFLREIAQMIIKQMVLNALQSASQGGGWVGALASAVVGTKHTGGMVGSGGRTRRVNPAIFANAPRLHGGGIPGLQQGEYATILKKNEEVLTESDPRNALNGGGGQSAAMQDVTIANYVDSESFMQSALARPSGRKMIMNVLSAERSQLRALVGAKG